MTSERWQKVGELYHAAPARPPTERAALAIEPHDPGVPYNVACVYALQGAVEDAIDCLEKAVQFGFGHKEWIKNDSDLDALRDHPRFQALLQRL